jgi:hypothetical protein
MALIVEDGSGLSNSESYISVADADARQASVGNDIWAPLSTAEKEEALRRATIYMTAAYRERWVGRRNNLEQALEWPRYGVSVEGWPVSPQSVPADVAKACSDLALKAAAGDLAPDLEPMVIREKVGPIETEFSRGSPQYKRFRAIDMMLSPYLSGGPGMVRLVRS